MNHKTWKKIGKSICKNCKTEFAIDQATLNRYSPSFCSTKCYNDFRKKSIVIKKAVCIRCKKEFEYSFHEKYKNQKERQYCSHSCQTKNSHMIPTVEYNGKIYRSSWEVNFVMFLEKYHLTFEYEPTTFKLSESISYTPDFYIYEYGCWVEIKGKDTEEAKAKRELFKEKISKNLYVIDGGEEFCFVWWLQEVFNRNFFNSSDLTLEHKQELTKEWVIHLMAEVTEILNTINWKMHQDKKTNEVIESQLVSEIVDVFKYMMGIAQIWGMSPGKFLDEAWKKSKIVELKYCYGRELTKLKNKEVVACDIDGVLNDYPNNFLNFINDKLKSSFTDYKHAKKEIDPKVLIDLKTEFREKGLEANGTINEDSKQVLKELKKQGKYIILLTARPKDIHPNLFYDTWRWLQNNSVNFDAIYFSKYKHLEIIKKVPNLQFMIEDNLEYANQIGSRGFKVYLLDNIYNQGVANENVIRIKSLKEIDYGKQRHSDN